MGQFYFELVFLEAKGEQLQNERLPSGVFIGHLCVIHQQPLQALFAPLFTGRLRRGRFNGRQTDICIML